MMPKLIRNVPAPIGPYGPYDPSDASRRAELALELKAVGVLWRREIARLLRNRTHTLLVLLNPLLFLLILGTGLAGMMGRAGGDYRAYLFPGVLVMAVLTPAMSAGSSIVREREVGFLKGVMVAPVRRGTLLVGKCLGGATAATLQGGLLLALAGLVGLPHDPVIVVLVLAELALVSLVLTTVGALIAVTVKDSDTFSTLLGLAMMPMVFLSGAFFSVRGLPGWLAGLTLANPLTYAVDALRRTFGQAAPLGSTSALPSGPSFGGWTPPVSLELLVMCVLGLAALALATRRFSRTG